MNMTYFLQTSKWLDILEGFVRPGGKVVYDNAYAALSRVSIANLGKS